MTHRPIRAARRIRAAIAALTIALAGAGCTQSPEERRAQVAREVVSNPDNGELWSVIQREYPQDFDALVARFADASLTGDDDAVRALSAQLFSDFMLRVSPDLAFAPDEDLHALAGDFASTTRALQRRSPQACAALAVGTPFNPSPRDTYTGQRLARLNTTIIKASAAGRDARIERREPDDADWQALGAAMLEDGADQSMLDAIDSGQVMTLPIEQQCRIGLHFYRGLASLPQERSARIAARALTPNP